MYDIIIIGGGPAGLSAALYARRAQKSTLVIEKDTLGGQITASPKVENFPTIMEISGLDIADRMTEQIMSRDAEIELGEVVSLKKDGDVFEVVLDSGDKYEARSVIVATGARPKRLELPGEEDFVGNGLSFCAVCDGSFHKGKDVAVAGGGNTAVQDALYLSAICSKVYLIHRRDKLRADKALCDALKEKENIEIIWNSNVSGLLGDGRLAAIEVKNNDGTKRELEVSGFFEAIGHDPVCNLLPGLADLAGDGFAAASEDCRTKTPGLFIAGDCRHKDVRQLSTAIADGAVAATEAGQYLDRDL